LGNTSTCVILGRIGEKKNILWLLYSMFWKKVFGFSRMLDHFSKCNWAIEEIINNEFTFVEVTYAIFDLGHDFPFELA
jgi:hypothetical protein